jgi:hypothetical protein
MDLQKYQVETWVSYLSPSTPTQLDTHIWTQCRSLKAGLALTVGLNLTYSLSLYFFKTSENKTPIDLDKISEGIFPNL